MKKVEVKVQESTTERKGQDYRVHNVNWEVDRAIQFFAADTVDAVSIALQGTVNRTPIARRIMLGWIEASGILKRVAPFLSAYEGLAEKFPSTYNDCRPLLPQKDEELTPAVLAKVAELVALDYASLKKEGQFPFRRQTTKEGSAKKSIVVPFPFSKVW